MDQSAIPFTAYGLSHLSALTLGAIIALSAILLRRKNPAPALTQRAETLFALGLLATQIASWLIYHLTGRMTPDHLLPCHLCDLATIACAIALIKKIPLASELAYFWGLGASLQGLITPNLAVDFPHPLYFTFFILHLGIVITALYLPLGCRWRPRPEALRYVSALSLGYLALVGLINYLLGSNYAFVCRRPEQPSLLDLLGPWPYYLIWMTLLGLGAFALLALPFWRPRRSHS
jgi:hypothetical integral membrane protein (TIGR02206 family)